MSLTQTHLHSSVTLCFQINMHMLQNIESVTETPGGDAWDSVSY